MISLICLSCICLLLLFNIPLPININSSAFEVILHDIEYTEARTVTIQGRYSLNISRGNLFTGSIEISGYPELDNVQFRIPFMRGFRDMYQGIIFLPVDNNPGNDITFGLIHSNGIFRQVIITVFEPYHPEYNRLIVLNAYSHEDAYNTAFNFMTSPSTLLDSGLPILD